MSTTPEQSPEVAPEALPESGPQRAKRNFRPYLEAIAAGLLLALAMPPFGWWPLAFIGITLLVRLLKDQTYKGRLLRSSVVFAVYFLVSMAWISSLHLAAWPALTVIETAVLAPIVALTPGKKGRWLAFPATLMLAEAIRWSWPLGGVPLANLPLTQVNGPLLPTARLFTALTIVGLLGVVAIALDAAHQRDRRSALKATAIVVITVMISWSAPQGEQVAIIKAALVQGGGELGTHAITSDSDMVFERHFERTLDVPEGTDLVLWPEDVLDVEGPAAESEFMRRLQALTGQRDFVLVAGVVEGDGDTYYNASVVIDKDGKIVDRYDKVNLVPYGEYVPFRGFLGNFIDLSRLPRDATPGSGPGDLDTPYGRMGIAISFEIFFPRRSRSGIKTGGRLLLAPTNSSSYKSSQVPEQTLASARLRAVENGRWMIQASPTGYGAFVNPQGTVTQRSNLKESIVLSQKVELREKDTLSVKFGRVPLLWLSVIMLGLAWRSARKPEEVTEHEDVIVDDLDTEELPY